MTVRRLVRLAAAVALVAASASTAMGYTGATVSVYDIQSTDVPGPQPIRAFPPPAAAGWADADLIYDNYAESLGFSASINYPDFNWVDLPLGNADVTINGLGYGPGVTGVFVDNSYQLLTNEEGSDADPRADNRFPYHVPRPSRYCGDWFTAVQFDLASPAGGFGVFLPGATNTWDPDNPKDDHNFQVMARVVDVFIQGVGESFEQAQHVSVSLGVGAGGSYCPFLMVEANPTEPIQAVSVIHDCYVGQAPTFGFMDVYVGEPAGPIPGDATHDGWVDGRDYTCWADNYEPGVTGKTWEQGDFTGDTIVDGADYPSWADNYTSAPDVPPLPQQIPEPGALALTALGAAAMLARKRK